MKLWVDDLREPPESWTWAKTSAEAINLLVQAGERGHVVEEISLDHDLGGDDTTRPVMRWMCDPDNHWPDKVHCHTANPVGREYLEGMIRRYKPEA